MATKLSKSSKQRLTRMTKKEQQAVFKAAVLLADCEVITAGRFRAVSRTLLSHKGRSLW